MITKKQALITHKAAQVCAGNMTIAIHENAINIRICNDVFIWSGQCGTHSRSEPLQARLTVTNSGAGTRTGTGRHRHRCNCRLTTKRAQVQLAAETTIIAPKL